MAPRSHARTRVFDHSYALAPGGSFLLQNVNGSVYISGWERDEVEIVAVKTLQFPVSSAASLRPTSDALDSVQIAVRAEAGRIAVRTLYPRGEGAEVGVDYHIRVPSRVLLEAVGTVNGVVHVRDVNGGGLLSSVNGDVEVLDSSGHFSAKTTNGNVHLAIHQLIGGAPMNLETVNGSVVLALPADVHADLQVAHMNGDFTSELPVQTSGMPLAAPVLHAKLGSGGAEISIHTVNGAVRLIRDPMPLPL